MACLIGCAAGVPESRPVSPPAVNATEIPTVPAHELGTQPGPVEVGIPPAEYPREALEADFQGAVTLKILIDETGRVREARVLKDPGRGLGDAAARSAVAHFRFSPARSNGQAVATWWLFTVSYVIPRR